ncbi:DMT family transporter [Hydrotalea sp.]|uniref:DMT family transporter n=1 Tax=Hydrotalea sp. TaxID=2881279 RepID=UPI00258E85C8|nr:DMT family transporter [Hydrotalea sp.]
MNKPFLSWFLFVMLSIIWGSSFILMKEGMQALTPYQVATIRILSAGIILTPFGLKAFKSITVDKRWPVLVSGLLGSFFPAYLFCLAETKLDSSLAGILNALTPLFTIATGILFFQQKIKPMQLLGVLLGFGGLLLLFFNKGHFSFTNVGYALFILLATFLYGLNVNYVRKHLQGIGSLHIASMAFVLLMIPCLVILSFTGYFTQTFITAVIHATLFSALLGIMGTAVATVLFYILLKQSGALFASMVTYGIPFVAVGWGVLTGEVFGMNQLISMLLILTGVSITNRYKK